MRSRYPHYEEWRAIQGGEPLIFANEDSTVFQIAHVYHPQPNISEAIPSYSRELAKKLGHYGCLIDTPAVQLNASVREPMELLIGSKLMPVILPAVMSIHNHGRPCAQRSEGFEGGYSRIESDKTWNQWLATRAKQKWDVWQVQQTESGKLKLSILAPVETLLTV